MGNAMKLPIPRKSDDTSVALALVKSGRPWMGYTLTIICHALGCLGAIACAILIALYAHR